jgi:hypothetical protein
MADAAPANGGGSYERRDVLDVLSPAAIERLRSEVLLQINREVNQGGEEVDIVIPRLIASCSRESYEVRRAVNSLCSSQSLEASRALRTLQNAHEKVQDLRDSFIKQGEIISSMQCAASYSKFRQLHFFHQNVSSIISWTTALKEVSETGLFAQNIDNLRIAEVYKQLRLLQTIRKTVQEQSSRFKQEKLLFSSYFEKVDFLVAMFVAKVVEVYESAAIIAIEAGLALEEGEATDKHYTALKECVAVCAQESSEPLLSISSPTPLGESVVQAAVVKSVIASWEDQVLKEVIDPVAETDQFIQNMESAIEPILLYLESAAVPLSAKFPVFRILVQSIHHEVMAALRQFIDSDKAVAASLIAVMKYCESYRSMLESNNFLQYVNPHEIDQMTGNLLTEAIDGMKDHMTNLAIACALMSSQQKIETRGRDGRLLTMGPREMSQILQDSLSTISSNIELDVLRKLGVACVEALRAYVEDCVDHADYDVWQEKSVGKPVEEWRNERLQLLIAYCNDLRQIEDDMEIVESRFSAVWIDEEEDGVSPFQEFLAHLPDLGIFYIDELIKHFFVVVEGPWSELFVSNNWAAAGSPETSSLGVILTTVDEYMETLEATLDEAWFKKLLTRRFFSAFSTRFLNSLVAAIRDPSRKALKLAGFSEALDKNTQELQELWGKYLEGAKGRSMIETTVNAIVVIMELIRVESQMALNTLIVQRILDNFGDCPTALVESVFEARADLDKNTKKEFSKLWKDRIAFQARDKNDRPTAGWTQEPSILGLLDRISTGPDGWFNSRKKREAAEKKAREEEERLAKERKMLERQSKLEARKKKKIRGAMTLPVAGGGGGEHEVESLASLIGNR